MWTKSVLISLKSTAATIPIDFEGDGGGVGGGVGGAK